MRKLLTLVLSVTSLVSLAQDAKDTKAWTPVVGLGLSSIAVDPTTGKDTSTETALSISPVFTLHHKSGLEFSYSPRLAAASGGGVYLHALAVGYGRYEGGKTDVGIEYNHYFFTGNSRIPYTPISNDLYASIAFRKSAVRPILSADLGFGTDTSGGGSQSVSEVAMAGGISHAFSWDGDDGPSFGFTPSLLLNLGTAQYFSFLKANRYISNSKKYNRYASKSKGKGKSGSSGSSGSSGNGNGNSGNGGSTAQKANFHLTNIELNLEGSMEYNEFTLRPGASLFIPTGKNVTHNLDGYWQLTLEYKF
jgi:hypothetical protein